MAAATARRTVAVVGGGVSGLTAGYLLQRAYDVTLYEAEPRLGGHAHTHDVVTPGERVLPIDSGFIVHNDRTYPYLLRLFDELGVATQATDMSMSVRCDGCGLEYAGARGLGGVFADGRNVCNPRFLRMLVEVKHFHRRARQVLDAPEPDPAHVLTLGEFLERGRCSAYFVQHFMAPVVSCVWSCPPQTALAYPAKSLFEFLDHHGALTVRGSPHWRTVVGGSRSYVERAAKELTATALSTPVRRLQRTAQGVAILDDGDETRAFDHAVVATHADEALALLARPTSAERAVLGAFEYSANETVLHTDGSGFPRHPRARASWNYRLAECRGDAAAVRVSYDMNRLHRLHEPLDYVVTLNGGAQVREEHVLARMLYTHPVYTRESVGAQARLPELNDGTLAYAGAYHGWGFHEDGCASGVRGGIARGEVVTSAYLYRTRLRHGRVERVRHRFEYRYVMWLVDVDDLPVAPCGLRGLVSFRARDHFGDPRTSIRGNVDAFLAEHGVDTAGGRVLLLTNPRSFGYAFNPLSVFWCYGPEGDLRGIVAEVHNTYGEHHCYFVRPDASGTAEVDKAFYVSPFFDVDGRYHMRLGEPGGDLDVAITLRRGADHQPVFTSTLRGQRAPHPVRSVVGATLRHPLGGLRVMARIRLQGILLWLRRVPIVPRPVSIRPAMVDDLETKTVQTGAR